MSFKHELLILSIMLFVSESKILSITRGNPNDQLLYSGAFGGSEGMERPVLGFDLAVKPLRLHDLSSPGYRDRRIVLLPYRYDDLEVWVFGRDVVERVDCLLVRSSGVVRNPDLSPL